jgi:hypothetical protein
LQQESLKVAQHNYMSCLGVISFHQSGFTLSQQLLSHTMCRRQLSSS